MDAKWKKLYSNSKPVRVTDENSRAFWQPAYGIQQSDLYQMFAYGKVYSAQAQVRLLLLYPRNKNFTGPLDDFKYNDSKCRGEQLPLRVLPIDLSKEEGELVEELKDELSKQPGQ